MREKCVYCNTAAVSRAETHIYACTHGHVISREIKEKQNEKLTVQPVNEAQGNNQRQ